MWFRAAIGRKKNAEARWLLPMICRRGGIDKHDIGAIRIMDTTTEFEISRGAAESFAAMIRRPDKEDNIRIEAMTEAPQSQPPQEKRSFPPRRDARAPERSERPNDRFRDERGPKPHGKPPGGNGPGSAREPGFDKKKKYAHKPADAGISPYDRSAAGKPAFGKKPKKKFRAGPG